MLKVNPEREENLRSLSLDKTIVESSGCHHVDADGVRYLDFVAQCGAVPFGHNPDFLVQTIADRLREKKPVFCTPCLAEPPADLAGLLFRHIPGSFDRCVFANSGTETTEAAIKLVRAATKRRKIVSNTNAFHGKTFGALCATPNAEYRDPFFVQHDDFLHVPYDDIDALESALQANDVAAFFVEPVQGEGGMLVPARDYLRRAKHVCERHGTLLVADEIQTGLGRTGYLTASEYFDVAPDVLLLAKALGGGVVPIGALLTRESVWTREFALGHSSTFAGNALCTAVGAEVVRRLVSDGGALLRHVREQGEHLGAGLAVLVARYPSVFARATGLGLMQAVHMTVQRDGRGRLMNFIGAPIVSSYLLNKHRIMTLLALNKKLILRIEPALIIERTHIDTLLAALDDVGQMLTSQRFREIYDYVKREEAPARAPQAA